MFLHSVLSFDPDGCGPCFWLGVLDSPWDGRLERRVDVAATEFSRSFSHFKDLAASCPVGYGGYGSEPRHATFDQ